MSLIFMLPKYVIKIKVANARLNLVLRIFYCCATIYRFIVTAEHHTGSITGVKRYRQSHFPLLNGVNMILIMVKHVDFFIFILYV